MTMTVDQMKSALFQIVARCHVMDSNKEVLKYASSRIKKKAWREMPLHVKVRFARACRQLHEDNRELYRAVMR